MGSDLLLECFWRGAYHFPHNSVMVLQAATVQGSCDFSVPCIDGFIPPILVAVGSMFRFFWVLLSSNFSSAIVRIWHGGFLQESPVLSML